MSDINVLREYLRNPPPNPCVKTGADVYFESHGGALHGDMFWLEGVYYFRFSNRGLDAMNYAADVLRCDYVLHNVELPGELCLIVGNTLLVHERHVTRRG